MTDPPDLNNLDEKMNVKGHIAAIHAILQEREKFDTERDRRINERFAALDKALELQAKEYERRLHDLNGEYVRDRQRQNQYVTTDKYENNLTQEREKREFALARVDEKFEDYIKRYEARQREVDLLLSAQKGAAEEAKRAAEEQGRKIRDETEKQGRKQARNLLLMGLVLTGLIAAINIGLQFTT